MIRLIRSLKDNSETKTPLHPGEAKLERFDLSGKALYKNQIIIIMVKPMTKCEVLKTTTNYDQSV